MNQIQKQKEAYYKQQGIAPGVPTEKGAYGDPENTGVGYNAVLSELGNHDVPQGWIQTPRPNTTPNTNPGPPVSWNEMIRATLMTRSQVTVIFQTILRKRKPSSIIVTTSVARLTGLYYYGARYMNPMASIWYGVDPLAEKYTTTGVYWTKPIL